MGIKVWSTNCQSEALTAIHWRRNIAGGRLLCALPFELC